MKIQVKLHGDKELQRQFANMAPQLDKELSKALFSIAKKIESDAKLSIQNGRKTGRMYKRRTIMHRASAPGEAPASDTGRLVNSINGKLKGRLTAVIEATAAYARHLEYGTRKMAARPYMRPAWEKNKQWSVDRIRKAVNIALKKAR